MGYLIKKLPVKFLYRFFFKTLGWKVEGRVPAHLKKYVLIVAPHTSNWDFLVGLAARSILDIDSKYVAKKELFGFPFGWLFRALGGYPVDRSKSNNFVDAVCEIFNSKEKFSIAITPEGTRAYAPKWKTGFYHIAQQLQIPVIMVAFDYAAKTVRVEPPMTLTGNIDIDIETMQAYYRKVRGKNPELGVR